MLSPKLCFKQCNYFALPASLRTFTISANLRKVEHADQPPLEDRDSIPKFNVRRIRMATIRKIPVRPAQPLTGSNLSSQPTIGFKQQVIQQMAAAGDTAEDNLRGYLDKFHSKAMFLAPDELSRVSTLLERYSELLRGLRKERDEERHVMLRGVQKSVPASYYRGGTSRAVMLQPKHLPRDAETRRALFLHIMGSPDAHGRQLNGMGAGVSSLSKICLVSPSTRPDADVDYTFIGVGIEGDETDYAGNCGNMSAAVGPFAFNEKLLGTRDYSQDGEVSITIYQTNTRKLIRSRFRVTGQQAKVDNETSIDGVSGMGTGVVLDFLNPEGSKTGALLPTGRTVDKLSGIEVSWIDAANPCVFVRASDIGIDPVILPDALLKEKETLKQLERIRAASAVAMGLCKDGETPPRVIPKIGIVSPPVQQTTLSEATVGADQVDIIVRFISDLQPHRAIPVTAALCTAAAAKTEGSIVQQCLRNHLVDGQMITIGHPSGRIQVNAQKEGGHFTSCSLVRTARRIWDGRIYWSEDPNLAPAKRIDEAFARDVFAEQDSSKESNIDDTQKPPVKIRDAVGLPES